MYNFDPQLQKIAQPDEFNYDCLPAFIPPSRDTNLRSLAHDLGAKFVTSTSSISASLGMIYFVVSNMKQLNLENLSSFFADESRSFTLMTRSPTSVILRPHEKGIRSVATEKVDSPNNILSLLGQSLERRLTMETPEFNCLLKGAKSPPLSEDLDGYAHSLAGDLLMRSQLDCYDPRLPRRSFDLKTRATLPIRMNIANYKAHLDYRILCNQGLFYSFEREFFDMCRSALLKYNFQVRIGNMDGIFVAFHNTAEIFGFQYLGRDMMDEYLFGNCATGDAAFLLITQLYNELLALITPQYGDKEIIRLTFSISKTGSKLTIFAESIPEVEGRTLAPNASHFRQYTLTAYSSVNSIRTDNVLLNPIGGDTWRLYYTLSEVAPDLGEFMSARTRVSDILTGGTQDTSRNANEFFARSIPPAPLHHHHKKASERPIIAVWTFPHK